MDGRYSEAVAAFSTGIQKSPSQFLLNNRGMAYLNLGDFDAALADFQQADAIHCAESKTETDRDKCGVALWMAGRYQEAVETWTLGVKSSIAGKVKYTDRAGGVTVGNLLFFAGVRTGNKDATALATRLLHKRLKGKTSLPWPGPVSQFLLGEIAKDAMVAAVSSVAKLREREMCQAKFYTGVLALSTGQNTAYLESMHEAVTFGSVSKLEAEYYLALHEEKMSATGRGDCP